jgi:hypothetical protein
MKMLKVLFPGFLAAAMVMATGCGKKQSDPESALQDAVKEMEKGIPESTAAPAPVTPAPGPAPAQPANAPPPPVAAQMNQAVSAYKGGNYVDAVARLQQLRAMKGKTPEQTLALQEAIASVMGELYTRASKGDTRAQAAVKEYERIQNSRQ